MEADMLDKRLMNSEETTEKLRSVATAQAQKA